MDIRKPRKSTSAKYNLRSMMPPTDTFTCFPLLPPEIRLKIWHHTFEPREIDHGMLYDFYHPRPPPPIALHINHESRTEALSLYIMLETWGKMTRPWLSPTLDTVCVPFTTFPGAPRFRNIASDNLEFHDSVEKIEVWCQDLQKANQHMDYRFLTLGKYGAWNGNDAWLCFRGVDELVFRMDEGSEWKDYGAFLERIRVWYGTLRDFKVPRVLRVVGREGNKLAALTDGVLVVTADPKVFDVVVGSDIPGTAGVGASS